MLGFLSIASSTLSNNVFLSCHLWMMSIHVRAHTCRSMHVCTCDPQNRAGFQDLHRQRQNNKEKVLLIRRRSGKSWAQDWWASSEDTCALSVNLTAWVQSLKPTMKGLMQWCTSGISKFLWVDQYKQEKLPPTRWKERTNSWNLPS